MNNTASIECIEAEILELRNQIEVHETLWKQAGVLVDVCWCLAIVLLVVIVLSLGSFFYCFYSFLTK